MKNTLHLEIPLHKFQFSISKVSCSFTNQNQHPQIHNNHLKQPKTSLVTTSPQFQYQNSSWSITLITFRRFNSQIHITRISTSFSVEATTNRQLYGKFLILNSQEKKYISSPSNQKSLLSLSTRMISIYLQAALIILYI